tara:strand:- start:3960 stop:4760 length:801 start_codon:yes stop_codon:yes gene_type:complete
MEKLKNVTIGSDPEIFLEDNKGNVASVIGLIGGTKKKPINIGNGCFLQEDNILAEGNIPPCKTKQEFLDSLNYLKDYIELVVSPLNLNLRFSSSERVDETILMEDGANVFGCASSFNFITEDISSLSEMPENYLDMRSSGFHIHYGWDNPTYDQRMAVVLLHEIFVSLPRIVEDNDHHDRRAFYGKFGDSRLKEYGVEARSLGGYFMKDDDSINRVWDDVQKVIEFYNNNEIDLNLLRSEMQFLNEKVLDFEKVNELILKYQKQYV